MKKENIIQLLDKFNIEYKKHGEEKNDAISYVDDDAKEITVSAWDDECEVCTVTATYLQNPYGGCNTVISRYGWCTYSKLADMIVAYANRLKH